MPSARIAYVELPITDIGASKPFFEAAFGWSLTEFGPTYSAAMGYGADLGLQGDPAEHSAAPLVGIEVDDLEAALAAVEGAGGAVTKPIFAYPGGRRFHFREPSGNELAVYTSEH
jgi:predicted enzyme related to lactoylglutathione lyase